jgi:hypothetical protein
MRSANGIPPRVALPPAALTFLHAYRGDGRAARLSPVKPPISPAPDSATLNSVNQHISLKPSGFPFLRVTL